MEKEMEMRKGERGTEGKMEMEMRKEEGGDTEQQRRGWRRRWR